MGDTVHLSRSRVIETSHTQSEAGRQKIVTRKEEKTEEEGEKRRRKNEEKKRFGGKRCRTGPTLSVPYRSIRLEFCLPVCRILLSLGSKRSSIFSSQSFVTVHIIYRKAKRIYIYLYIHSLLSCLDRPLHKHTGDPFCENRLCA